LAAGVLVVDAAAAGACPLVRNGVDGPASAFCALSGCTDADTDVEPAADRKLGLVGIALVEVDYLDNLHFLVCIRWNVYRQATPEGQGRVCSHQLLRRNFAERGVCGYQQVPFAVLLGVFCIVLMEKDGIDDLSADSEEERNDSLEWQSGALEATLQKRSPRTPVQCKTRVSL
jgi:hypothetical protein